MSTGLILTRRQVIIALAGATWTMACGPRRTDAPVAISYGRDECAWCRMTVDDPTLAAEWVLPDGPPLIFGEAGCLLAWIAAHRDTVGRPWVRNRDADEWLPAAEASYARGIVTTPMAFNLTAHRRAPSPAPAVTVVTWPELLEKGTPDARPN